MKKFKKKSSSDDMTSTADYRRVSKKANRDAAIPSQ